MREALAKALSGPINLDEQAHERPVDRLHALASAQIDRANRTARAAKLASLGVSIIALKHANRPDEYNRSITRLADCLAWPKPRPSQEVRLRVARQAVQEWVIDFCPTCKGVGEVPAQEGLEGAQRMRECPECGGHGKRRYSDAERLTALELEAGDYVKMARWMADAMGFIARAEDEAVRSAKRLLERW